LTPGKKLNTTNLPPTPFFSGGATGEHGESLFQSLDQRPGVNPYMSDDDNWQLLSDSDSSLKSQTGEVEQNQSALGSWKSAKNGEKMAEFGSKLHLVFDRKSS
jgi:hypothetical protein